MSVSRLVFFSRLLTVVALGLPALAHATDAPSVTATEDAHINSINANPLGLLFGSYALNYERLMEGGHGFMVEGTFNSISATATNASSSTSGGIGLGYRWHWSKVQDSGFVGLSLGYETGTAKTTVTTSTGGGTPTTSAFDLTVSDPYFVMNIGRRFAWDSGFNITLRIGAGRAAYNISSTSTDPDVKTAIKQVEDAMNTLPIKLDGELSAGFCF